MKSFHFFVTGILAFNLLFCSCQNEQISQNDSNNKKFYTNPVVNKSLPDPTVIKARDGCFYLFATEDIRNTPIHKSKDLVNWEYAGTAFTNETRPDFEPEGGLWAPDINYINGQYVLFYSMSVWGGEWTCGIGVATSKSPGGSFTDKGKLFRSNEIGVQNSIDPFYIEENGKHYLFWGSFSGIYAIELTSDGLLVKPGAEKQQIAGTAYEGVYIHKNDRFVGTGHNSEIVKDDAGNNWIFYHAVDKNNPLGRVLMLDEVRWQNGWPYVKGNNPSKENKKPEFN